MKGTFLKGMSFVARGMRVVTVAAVITALVASPARVVRAQEKPTLGTLVPGDTLRVWAVAPRLNGARGILDRFRDDTLTMLDLKQLAGQREVVARVPYSSLTRVDVQRGKHRSAARIAGGALIGAAGGLLIGATLGPIIECGSSCGTGGDLEGVAGFVLGGAAGIVVGGVAGGFIGARFRVPKWEAVRLVRP